MWSEAVGSQAGGGGEKKVERRRTKKMDGEFKTAHQKTNISIYLAWQPATASLY